MFDPDDPTAELFGADDVPAPADDFLTDDVPATGDPVDHVIVGQLPDGTTLTFVDENSDDDAEYVGVGTTDGEFQVIEPNDLVGDDDPGTDDPGGEPIQTGLDDGTAGGDDGGLGYVPVDASEVVIDPGAETVIGDPLEASEYFLYQGLEGTCAPTTVAMVLSETLGVPIESNQDVVQRAVDLGLIEYDPATGEFGGMGDQTIMLLMESYGVDVALRYGDMSDLANYLEAGYPIMVGVDSDEIYGSDDDATDGGFDDNHELQVTGIDPVNDLVYLNNPNNEQGTMVIPLEQFANAWADAGNSIITTDVPTDDAGAAIPGELAVDLIDHEDGGDHPMSDGDVTPLPVEEPVEPQPAGPEDDVTVGGGGALGITDPTGSERPAIDDPWDLPTGTAALLFLPFAFVVRSVATVASRKQR